MYDRCHDAPLRRVLAYRGAVAILLLLVSVCYCQHAASQVVDHWAVSREGDRRSRDQAFAELADDVDALERQFSIVRRAVELVVPSVVHIEARPLRGFANYEVEEAGSGVVVRLGEDSYVLTNRHVIRNSNPDGIQLELSDGRGLSPQRIWSDPDTDVAIMSIRARNLIPARLGNSNVAAIGEQVLAVGSPFNLRHSVTRGIISARGRHSLELGDGGVAFQNFIQTDAAINPGNSGGPLVNLKGEVIGLNTAIASSSGGSEGIGFAIPIDVAIRIANELVTNGAVTRGYLGVRLNDSFDRQMGASAGLPRLTGTRIEFVEPDSPAAQADLLAEDIVMAYDGHRVDNLDHLIGLVKLTEAGRIVRLTIYRDGKVVPKRVQIGSQKSSSQSGRSQQR